MYNKDAKSQSVAPVRTDRRFISGGANSQERSRLQMECSRIETVFPCQTLCIVWLFTHLLAYLFFNGSVVFVVSALLTSPSQTTERLQC